MSMNFNGSLRRPALGAVLASALLAGCASLDQEAAFQPVQSLAGDRLGVDLTWARTEAERSEIEKRVQTLLEEPLGMDQAVELALLNNRALQAGFETLGITEAERVQAGRLGNPGFAFGRSRRGDEREIERAVHFNLARLIFLPTISKLESKRLAETQRAVAMQVLDLAARTRKAWIDAVAAVEAANYSTKVKRMSEVSGELARRMAKIGNFSKLQQAREQSFYADAAVSDARARHQMVVTREALTRLLGLFGEQRNFRLPERLPDLPDEPTEQPDAVQQAVAQRLDLAAARLNIERLADNIGVVRTGRFISVLEVAAFRNTSNLEPTQTGWEIDVEIPIFDWGDAKVARAEAMMRQAVNRAAQAAIDARSEVSQAYSGYRTTFDIARHYRDEIVPLRKRISEENIYRYNGMIIGVFELLADSRAQITAVDAYIRALRDFWIAKTDLDAALIGRPSLSAMSAGPAAAADDGGAAH